MQKHFSKLIVFLLVPCLIADPAVGSNRFADKAIASPDFLSQAIIAQLLLSSKRQPIALARASSVRRQIAEFKPRPMTLLDGLRAIVRRVHEDGLFWPNASIYSETMTKQGFILSFEAANNILDGLFNLELLERQLSSEGYRYTLPSWLKNFMEIVDFALFDQLLESHEAPASALLKGLLVNHLQTQPEFISAYKSSVWLQAAIHGSEKGLTKILRKMHLNAEVILRELHLQDHAAELLADLHIVYAEFTRHKGLYFGKMVEGMIHAPSRWNTQRAMREENLQGQFRNSIVRVANGSGFVAADVRGFYIVVTNTHVIMRLKKGEAVDVTSAEHKPRIIGQADVVLRLKKDAYDPAMNLPDLAFLVIPKESATEPLRPIEFSKEPITDGEVATVVSAQNDTVASGFMDIQDGQFVQYWRGASFFGDSGSPLVAKEGRRYVTKAVIYTSQRAVRPTRENVLDMLKALAPDGRSKDFKINSDDQKAQEALATYLEGLLRDIDAASKPALPPPRKQSGLNWFRLFRWMLAADWNPKSRFSRRKARLESA
jgi:hypothetical protein